MSNSKHGSAIAMMLVAGGLLAAAPSVGTAAEKCNPAAMKCGPKCAAKCGAKHSANRHHAHAAKCAAAKCGPKCGAKCKPAGN